MVPIEELEIDAHRAQLGAIVRSLVDKYLAMSGWDMPVVDEGLFEWLIVQALQQPVDGVPQRGTL